MKSFLNILTIIKNFNLTKKFYSKIKIKITKIMNIFVYKMINKI